MRLDELFHLSEKRRNPEQNPKLTPMEQLKKYAGEKDVFVSFTQDVGSASHFPGTTGYDSRHQSGVRSSGPIHNTRGAKLGINPKSTYETPIGIYSYPVDYVLLKDGDVDFAGNSPYMHVFRAEGNFLDIAAYKKEDLERDIEKLEKLNMDSSVIRKGISGADPQTPAGKIWNITRLLSKDIAQRLNDAHYDDDYADDDIEPDEDEFDSYEEYKAAYRDWEDGREERQENQKEIAKAPVQWSVLLRQIGYDGAVDYKGKGVLHENEPVQAVFFTKKNTKVLDVIYNRTQADEYTIDQIVSKRPDLFTRMFTKGRIDLPEAVRLLKQNPYLLGKIGWKNIPKPVQEYMVTNYAEFLADHNNDFLTLVPLPAATVIDILRRDPWRVNGIRLSAPVQKYVLDNFETFSKWLGGMKLSSASVIEKLKADPALAYMLPSNVLKIPPEVLSVVLDVNPERMVDYYRTYDWPKVNPVIAVKFFKWIMKSKYKGQWESVIDKAWDSGEANASKQLVAYMQALPLKLLKRFLDSYKFDAWDRNTKAYKRFQLCLKARPELAQYYPKPQNG